MALVNWDYLDKEYETLLGALVEPEKKVEKFVSMSKVVAQSKKQHALPEQITPAEEWDAFMLKNKGQMPPVMKEILESLKHRDAAKQLALMRFGVALISYWSEARAEVKQLMVHNAVMVAERQKFKDAEINSMLSKLKSEL